MEASGNSAIGYPMEVFALVLEGLGVPQIFPLGATADVLSLDPTRVKLWQKGLREFCLAVSNSEEDPAFPKVLAACGLANVGLSVLGDPHDRERLSEVNYTISSSPEEEAWLMLQELVESCEWDAELLEIESSVQLPDVRDLREMK
jgi:hypothetical protein